MASALSQMDLDIIPVSKWNNYFEYPTSNAIRQWMFRNTKGFNDIVLRKVGNRNCVKISAFKQWIDDTNK